MRTTLGPAYEMRKAPHIMRGLADMKAYARRAWHVAAWKDDLPSDALFRIWNWANRLSCDVRLVASCRFTAATISFEK